MHVPSGTVFSNWPTDKTPLRRVTCMSFSPLYNQGQHIPHTHHYLAIGNNKGKVLLYQVKHNL